MKFLKENKANILALITIIGCSLIITSMFYHVYKEPIFLEYPVLPSN